MKYEIGHEFYDDRYTYIITSISTNADRNGVTTNYNVTYYKMMMNYDTGFKQPEPRYALFDDAAIARFEARHLEHKNRKKIKEALGV